MHGHVLTSNQSVIPLDIGDIIEDLNMEAPVTRADCVGGPRPCPWIRCKWHAIWYLKPRLHYMKNLTDQQIVGIISAMKHSCVLDICDQGGATLDLIGELLQTTRERVRQIEELERTSPTGVVFRTGALAKLRRPSALRMIIQYRNHKAFSEEDYFIHGQ